MNLPAVITIDGPSGTGKGTLAHNLSKQLGWHYLDSGALYRSFAWAAIRDGVAADDDKSLVDLINNFTVCFKVLSSGKVLVTCQDEDVTTLIRTEEIGMQASLFSSNSLVRKALIEVQHGFRQSPGLVTDGRDMGTVVFPDANYKFFLTASANERAKRRFKQLQLSGINGNLRKIESALQQRDERDRSRVDSPMVAAQDAIVIDTTSMAIEDVISVVLEYVNPH
jgi:CMP/dCMP kinase